MNPLSRLPLIDQIAVYHGLFLLVPVLLLVTTALLAIAAGLVVISAIGLPGMTRHSRRGGGR